MLMNRRAFLAGSAALGPGVPAMAQTPVDIAGFGLVANADGDQSAALQKAVDRAANLGLPLLLPGGVYRVGNILLPAGSALDGVPGATILVLTGEGPILSVEDARNVYIDGVTLDGGGGALTDAQGGLLRVARSSAVSVTRCTIVNSRQNGVAIEDSALRMDGCEISGAELSGLFSLNSLGLMLSGNRIHACNNGGVRIWRSEAGSDGSIISGNSISDIGTSGGGNGQNGNGVNIFRADDVIVADNHFANCAFSAVRVNAGKNTQVTGNTCLASGEVAIFSEFEFSGSVIANNIVDGAAAGISMTNLDAGGALAVCSGNIVRNISERSAVNPDTSPYGIYAEAESVVTGNVVENVPGIGIGAGHGPFLRNVMITGNVIRAVKFGIAVTVAEQPEDVRIDGNMISGVTGYAIVGLKWDEIASTSLVADAGQYRHVHLGENTVVD
jgi:uncharacterized secreted repeat protein (TIGR03808 family)